MPVSSFPLYPDFLANLVSEIKEKFETQKVADLTQERRDWTLQLCSEFDNICFQYRVKLSKPVIEISNGKSQWGQWNPHLRILSISAELIEKHSWECVLGVLKHEMAHQVVTEIFEADDAHGALFLKACSMLGVPEEFRGATTDMPENKLHFVHWKNQPRDTEESGLLRKVEKLLALAGASNEHESYLAMQRVQELFARYNIERIQAKKNSKYVVLVVNHKKRRSDKNQRLISSILTGHYFVNVVFSDLYDSQERISHKTMEIMGTEQNVLMAEYVYEFLRERAESLWKQYQLEKKVGVAHKGSYQSGMLIGFRDKLDKSAKQFLKQAKVTNGVPVAGTGLGSSVSAQALIKLHDTELEVFSRERFPRIVSTRSSGKYLKDAYEAGHHEGQKMLLNKAVHSKGGQFGRLLGPH